MTQVGVMETEPLENQPLREAGESAGTSAKPQKLTLKYLLGLIQTLQEDQQILSARVDELTKLLHHANKRNEDSAKTEWAVAVIPDAAGHERPLRTSADQMQPNGSMLLELQKASRIAEEIAQHAAVEVRPAPAAAASEASAGTLMPGNEPKPVPDFYTVTVSRAERHQRPKKRSFWSKLFKREAK